MHLQWELIAAALLGFFSAKWAPIAAAIFGFFIASSATTRLVIHNVERGIEEERGVQRAEELMRFVRQDIAGVLTALFVTNGLLGAIIGVLILR
jgi:hypothetical protein